MEVTECKWLPHDGQAPDEEEWQLSVQCVLQYRWYIEGNGATSYFWQIPEQPVPALTNFQTARTDVIMFLTVSLHVEIVVLLSSTRKKPYATLDVDMDDYYRIKNEDKAESKDAG